MRLTPPMTHIEMLSHLYRNSCKPPFPDQTERHTATHCWAAAAAASASFPGIHVLECWIARCIIICSSIHWLPSPDFWPSPWRGGGGSSRGGGTVLGRQHSTGKRPHHPLESECWKTLNQWNDVAPLNCFVDTPSTQLGTTQRTRTIPNTWI